MDQGGLRVIRFGDYLVSARALTEVELLDSLAEHWATWDTEERIGDVICRRGYLAPEGVERYAQEYDRVRVVYVE